MKDITVKVAFSYWNNRIAPVFDTARQILVVDVEAGKPVDKMQALLPDEVTIQKVLQLVELHIDVLICGAISNPMHEMITVYGIQVVSFVSGELQEVIQAWLKGRIEHRNFIMPGCRGRGRRAAGSGKECTAMPGKGPGGMRQGRGRGQSDRNRKGGGRMSGQPFAAGAAGYCLCPKCGYQEAHERGVPCVQQQCPHCGISLTRQ